MPTIDIQGRPVSYRLDGPRRGPLLVLVNSLGLTVDMWHEQIPSFSGYFRVLRYEQRGHGGTPAPPGPYAMETLGSDLLELLDALSEPRASVVGLSIGGMVAMWAASHAPDRIARLVLCCTAPILGPAAPWVERASVVRVDGTASLIEMLVQRWLTPDTIEACPELVAHLGGMLAAADPEGYASCCEAIASMDQRGDLSAITAPTLVLAGADDPVVPPDEALRLQHAIPGSSLAVLAGASHLANLDQPDLFTETVLAHLLGGSAARAGLAVRRQVLGDAHVDRARTQTTAFTAPFQELITRHAWTDIWTRPGLDLPTRSCLTVAMLVALGRFDELPLHLRGALRNGVTTEEIAEVLLQCAVYCGVPAANSAFAVAQRVLEEAEEEA